MRITIMLIIALLVAVSFFGVYRLDEFETKNIMPEYLLGMEFAGGMTIHFVVDDFVYTEIHDSEGNIVEPVEGVEYTEEAGYQIIEERVNTDEMLTEENFLRAKTVLEHRLNAIEASQYEIRLNTETGQMSLTLPIDDHTTVIYNAIMQLGIFEIQDADDREEAIERGDGRNIEALMDNSHIANATVLHGPSPFGMGVSVFLNISFNREGTERLEELSREYMEKTTTNEEGEIERRGIALVYDGSLLRHSMYFDEVITRGEIDIMLGVATTDEELMNIHSAASDIAIALNSGPFPIYYETMVEEFTSTIEPTMLRTATLIAIGVFVLALVGLVARFGAKGIYAAILQMGYLATLLLIVRFALIIITPEGIAAIILSVIINYIAVYMLLHTMKKEDLKFDKAMINIIKKLIAVLIPVYIIAIVLSFTTFANLAGFGTGLVWGTIVFYLYNIIFTRALLKE